MKNWKPVSMFLESAKTVNHESILFNFGKGFVFFVSRKKTASIIPWEKNQTMNDIITLLEICPDGQHFAFFQNETFFLLNITGHEVYSKRINTDKANPSGIRFSPDGEIVAFFYEDDMLFRISLYSISQGYTSHFESGWIPFGCDTDLKSFIRNNAREIPWRELLRQLDPCNQKTTITNPKKMEENISIYDRRGTIREKFYWDVDWLHLGINNSMGVLLTKDYQLEWYSGILTNPILVETLSIESMLPDEKFLIKTDGNIAIYGDNVVFTYPLGYGNKAIKEALFLNYRTGLKNKISNIIPIHLDSDRFIVQKKDSGKIVSYDRRGQLEFSSQDHDGNFAAVACYISPYLNCADISISDKSLTVSAYTMTIPENKIVFRWNNTCSIPKSFDITS